MPRTHGYSLKGQRCYGEHDWGARGRTNAIGALLENNLITVSLFEGTINGDTFECWIDQDLIPKLPAQSIVVMDNAAFHKRATTLEKIINAGHILEFLPPYSPDLNPIEHKWAQVKAIRRKQRCSVNELFQYHCM
jgi:transposase